jgi:hypothetical protein
MKGISNHLLVAVLLALGFGIYFALPGEAEQVSALGEARSEGNRKLRPVRGPTEAEGNVRLARRIARRDRNEADERMERELAALVAGERRKLEEQMAGLNLKNLNPAAKRILVSWRAHFTELNAVIAGGLGPNHPSVNMLIRKMERLRDELIGQVS